MDDVVCLPLRAGTMMGESPAMSTTKTTWRGENAALVAAADAELNAETKTPPL